MAEASTPRVSSQRVGLARRVPQSHLEQPTDYLWARYFVCAHDPIVTRPPARRYIVTSATGVADWRSRVSAYEWSCSGTRESVGAAAPRNDCGDSEPRQRSGIFLQGVIPWGGRRRQVRATRILYLSILLVSACGGATTDDKPLNVAAAGAGAVDNQIQVVDDVDHTGGQYPPVPSGSAAFFWRGGLGNWFVSNSDAPASRDASVDDVTPPRGTSTKAYHVSETEAGTPVDLWAQLNHPQGSGVNLGSYSGVTFWARMNGSSGDQTVAVGGNGQLSKVASAPRKVVSVSQEWREFVVRFDEVSLDSSAVSSIDFVMGGRTEPIDLWIDDLGFLCRGKCP
jgi:hypothetical protein